MTTVDVLIPVLDRPHRVRPLVESLAASSADAGHEVTPVFVCSPGDDAELAEVRAAGLTPLLTDWPGGSQGDYARKMNLAFSLTDAEWKFLAADDLVFHGGWLQACLRVHERSGACVVGTNDLGNGRVMQGVHSTHTLVHRDYLECGTIDEAGKVLHEGYWHNYCDDEFVQTAQWRRTYAPAGDAVVEHFHPDWGKAEWDETYRIGKARFGEDGALYEQRKQLWERGGGRGTW